jgi:hypothetical protein
MSKPSDDKGAGRSEGAAVWKERIERSRQSGLPIRAFCKREGVRLSTYYRWRLQLYGRVKQKGKLGKDKPIRRAQRPFIPVRVKEEGTVSPPSRTWACEVSGAGRVRVRLRERPAWGELLQLLAVMGGNS